MRGTSTSVILMCSILLLLAALSCAHEAHAKSLYLIANINADPTPIHAYDIQPAPSYLAFQSAHGVPYRAGGGVGLGIDSDSATLFVTYEGSNIIELVNATTMNSTGFVEAPGASNLAGIVYDRNRKELYTVDRETNHLYVYSWDSVSANLTLLIQEDLHGVTSAHGLALDEAKGHLYVGDMVTRNPAEAPRDNIKVFSADDWSPVANYTVNQSVQGIALDPRRRIVYVGHSYQGYGSKGLLIKLDLRTLEEKYVAIGNLTGFSDDNAVGLGVDTDTGLLYVTTGNQGGGGSDWLMVFNSELTLLHNISILYGAPTGIAVPTGEISYNPLSLTMSASKERVSKGDRITYRIGFDNLQNEFEITGVVLEDTLPPELDFVSASEPHEYDPETRRIRWVFGVVEARAGRQSVSMVARVTSQVSKGDSIGNAVTISSDQTPPTTQWSFTNVSGIGLGGAGPMARDAAVVAAAVVASYVVGWAAATGVTKMWLIPKGAELSTRLLVNSVTKYGITILGGLFVLAQTEIEPAPVIVGAGAAGIAFAFGSKELLTDYLCGVIVLVDRPLKRGDVVDVEGAVGEVLDVGLRATSIRTLDNVTHLVPNSLIILRKITNYTKYDPTMRIRVPVGVVYGSDMEKVREAMLSAAGGHTKILKEPAPEARIVEYGDSSVNLELLAWIENPSERFKIKEELNWAISERFAKDKIRIPFSQRDVWSRS